MGTSINRYILLTSKNWHDSLFDLLNNREDEEWLRISNKEDFNLSFLENWKPNKIFIPHWSYIIPSEVFENFECIVFHMTDLPFGRGGSPLQNLILRGYDETKISAIRVEKGLDTGKIYLKKPLALYGSAQEIFLRSTWVIHEMIEEIILNNPVPKEQVGEPIHFKRRKPEEGNLHLLKETEEVFDYIRMLDCEGYPPAFLETQHFRFDFSRASMQADNSILADVRIIKK